MWRWNNQQLHGELDMRTPIEVENTHHADTKAPLFFFPLHFSQEEEVVVSKLNARPSDLLREHREEVLAMAESFGILEVRVFGSIARGDDGPDSDVDLIVSFTPGTISIGDLVAFEDQLSLLLGVPVDVVSAAARRIQTAERYAIAL